MTPELHLPGLQIDSPLVTPSAPNFRPSSWPPPPDFPVVIDAQGKVISRYGDPSWDLTVWSGKALKVSFGHGEATYRGAPISPENAELLREIAGQALFRGLLAVRAPNSLKICIDRVRPLAAVCSQHNVLISELWRFPHLIDEVAKRLPSSAANSHLGLLHRLFAHRDALGFVILDEAGIKRLAEQLPEHEHVQTPYIPPRIWTYQVLRLREFLDDYLAHKGQIEACFAFCLEAYRINAGGWTPLFKGELNQTNRPFNARFSAGALGHRRFHGQFWDTAKRFGIDGLIARWVGDESIRGLSSLLNMAREVGVSYALNFSLMRKDEGAQLREGCYSVEQDSLNQDVHLLASATSKTHSDPDARWICSPSVTVAIEAMTHATRLRLSVAVHDPRRRLSAQDRARPLLCGSATEPWKAGRAAKGERTHFDCYADIIRTRPLLFDPEQLRITQADLDIAQTMTMGLDPELFAVGKVWPLAWHQLRRTGVCNMLASGMVSEASLRYQLKHLRIVMTRYYGQNYFRLKGTLTDDATGFFLREMYQAIARGFAELSGDEYLSPHGQKRKDQILRPVTESDHKEMINAAKSGAITYRETMLGGCTQVTCVFGGITNIANCMGTAGEHKKPCDHLLINKNKRKILAELIDDFEDRLRQAPPDSPMLQSLMANCQAAEDAINVIDKN